MTIPISNITPIGMPQMTPAAGATGHPGEFESVLSSAISSIEGLQNKASDSVQKFLTGENEELHTTVLATQKAELAFELGLQVRNKVVDAYQEIMKMQM
ncbi:Flagellar hook-basal body complex protein FliE [Candidatus Sulfopaludibacter sp. SbA3]|nr:Flagellar hook-basal body complex protein FliE [Candidatus Sulfopaludibacter sp. SbA3]